MDKRRLALSFGLILIYMIAAVLYSRLIVPEMTDVAVSDTGIEPVMLGFAILMLVLTGVLGAWRSVGLVGRDLPPVGFVVALAIVAFVYNIVLFALKLFEVTPPISVLVWTLVNIALVALNEELMFRGYLFSAFPDWGPAGRILTTALVFGLFHSANGFSTGDWKGTGFQMAMTAFAGILDGVIRYGTGSLWPTIVLHFLWDAGGAISATSSAGGGVSVLAGVAYQFLFGLLGVVGLVVLARRHARDAAKSAQLGHSGAEPG